MQTILSYIEGDKRKYLKVPYYELQSVMQEIYESDKGTVDFDFSSFEQSYTYFKPYLDYILLYKEGRLESFLMDENATIYSTQEQQLYYFSNQHSRLHQRTHVVPFLSADDKKVMLNQTNTGYSSILLADGISLSHKEAKNHCLLMDFYLHQILSQSKDITCHYKEWVKEERHDPFLPTGMYLSLYLGVIRYIQLDAITYYTKNHFIQTHAQSEWLSKRETAICYQFQMSLEEIQRAKQFMKSFF